MRMWSGPALAAVVLVLCSASAHAASIDTRPQNLEINISFDAAHGDILGQTFVAGPDQVRLDSFGVDLRVGSALTIRGVLMETDGGGAPTGLSLLAGQPTSTFAGAVATQTISQTFDFVGLVPGELYFVGFEAVAGGNGAGVTPLGVRTDNPILVGTGWQRQFPSPVFASSPDLAFVLQTSAIPEPSAAALFALGGLGLLLRRRRRRPGGCAISAPESCPPPR